MEGRPLEDEQLVELARNGDIGAYELLVQRYQALAHRVAVHAANDPSEADDAVQEAFVKAFYALDRFRRGAAFKPWLLRIVANEARNRGRSARRRAGLAARATDDRASGDAAPSPEDAVLVEERRQAVMAALNRLRAEDRLVIALRYFEELSEKEMAEILGCRPGTVKSRLSRALGRLRRGLDELVAGRSLEAGDARGAR